MSAIGPMPDARQLDPSPSRPAPALFRALKLVLAVYGAFVLVGLLCVPLHFLPAEDVVILHQFSRNLAEHGAITYYAGGPHAEGATDFGWMLLVAGAVRVGLPPMGFTAIVNVLSLLALAAVLCRIARVKPGPVNLLALCGAAGMFPQILAAAAGFPVPVLALLLACLVLLVLEERALAAALVALLFCLIRPDGVVFCVPLLSLLIWRTPPRAHSSLLVFLAFVLPGAAYFAWRAHYFGSLLPLPFLVKADTHRVLGLFVPHTVTQSFKYIILLCAVLLSTGRVTLTQRRLLPGLVIVPLLFFWAMRLDQNVGDRFFYFLPLATALLLAVCWTQLESRPRGRVALVSLGAYLVFLLGPLLREVRSFRDYQFRDVQAIAAGMHQLPQRGTLLTTEAGFLAYDSGWIAYDAWGLNTAAFARHFIQPADVVTLQPDLIVLHPDDGGTCRLPDKSATSDAARSWAHMVHNLLLGVREEQKQDQPFEIWQLSYGSEYRRQRHGWRYGQGDVECFLVRQHSPLADGLASLLREHHAVPQASQ